MSLAFVHCWVFPGGALNVLKKLIEDQFAKHKHGLYLSHCVLFTLISEIPELQVKQGKIKIVQALPSWINQIFLFFTKHKFPVLSAIFDYRNLMFFYPVLMKILSRKIRKFNPEKLVISSFAIAKNIDVPNVYKMLYLHSPMQYIWSHYDEYNEKLKGRRSKLFHFIVPILRKRDLKYTEFDEVYSNSHYTAQLAKKLYDINAKVWYPKIDDIFWQQEDIQQGDLMDYYIYVGRLVNFVRETDRIIRLFNETKEHLLVVGSGPDEQYLKSIAGDTIIFLGQMASHEEILPILAKSRGLINLTKESFGLGTLEALALGVPVFGYDDGATPELVDKNSGILVNNKNPKTLLTNFNEFKNRKWDRKYIKSRAISMRESMFSHD